MSPSTYKLHLKAIGRQIEAEASTKPPAVVVQAARNYYRNLWMAFVEGWPDGEKQAFRKLQTRAKT